MPCLVPDSAFCSSSHWKSLGGGRRERGQAGEGRRGCWPCCWTQSLCLWPPKVGSGAASSEAGRWGSDAGPMASQLVYTFESQASRRKLSLTLCLGNGLREVE